MEPEQQNIWDEVRHNLEHNASVRVAAGFDSRGCIFDSLLDEAADEGLDATDSQVKVKVAELLDKAIEEHRQLQQTWPEYTDFDKLEAALEALRSQGIVSRHDFTCCGTCGSAEIHDELAEERKRGLDVRGYVFYHQQDTDHAVEGHGLHFNYGIAFGSNLSALDVGQALAAALRRAGLEVTWNESVNQRVKAQLDWKRRWTS